MLEPLILYSLYAFFTFHVAINADITEEPRAWVLERLPPLAAYSMTCAFCATWWITFLLGLFDLVPFYYAIAAPTIVLLINLTIKRLSE